MGAEGGVVDSKEERVEVKQEEAVYLLHTFFLVCFPFGLHLV